MEPYKVSIITPVFNAEKFLKDTIESVLAQTYQNWEMLFVDDCSNDSSVDLIKEYTSLDSRIKFFKNSQNSGPGPSRNVAIEKATGRFIAFLDSDDIWVKDKLKIHVNFMLKNEAAFSHTSYGYMDESGNIIKSTFHVSNYPISYNDLLKRTEISCLTAMYDINYTGKRFMPDLRRKQDYALWLNILKSGFKSIPLDQELAFYRQVKGSVTSNKLKLIFEHWLFLRNREKLGVFKSAYYLFHWGILGILKYYIK